jgi:hypothetical protein
MSIHPWFKNCDPDSIGDWIKSPLALDMCLNPVHTGTYVPKDTTIRQNQIPGMR